MANVSSVTKHFITGQEGFTTTLASTISSGAATVPLNSVSGYTNGEQVAFIIEPTDDDKKQVFTGAIDTSGVQVTGVVWTEGNNQTHTAGVTVVDYWTATHQAALVKGIKVSHDDDGSLEAGAVDVPEVIANGIVARSKLDSALTTEINTDWKAGLLPAVSSVTNNGNRSYNITFNASVETQLSPGMRLRTTRTVTAPTQCADLESSSSQYFSSASAGLAGVTFTDDFTCMGWVKLESYGAVNEIITRFSSTGWILRINASGQVEIVGTGASGNDQGQSYQSIPLNKWTHVAASLDMSGSSALIYIDGVLVPSTYANSASTSLTQAGDLVVGARTSGTNPFDGKLAQVAVFSSVLSASTIRSYMSQGLSGSESTLVSAYSCNNSLLDLNTTNNNDLTAQNSATMTNADSPFGQDASGVPTGTTDVELVMKVNGTTATVQVPDGCTIPTSGGVSAVAYSTATSPFGFTLDKDRWVVDSTTIAAATQGSPVAGTWYNLASTKLVKPVGKFSLGYESSIAFSSTGAAPLVYSTLSTANNTQSDARNSCYATGTSTGNLTVFFKKDVDTSGATAQTDYFLNSSQAGTGGGTWSITANNIPSRIYAIPVGI